MVIRIYTIINVCLFVIVFSFLNPLFSSEGEDHKCTFLMYISIDKLTFNPDESIILEIHIKNKSHKRESLKIYDVNYTSFQPVVYDMSGREADIIVQYRLMNLGMKDVIKNLKPRVIELSPNETIVHSVNLRNIYNIKGGRKYRVKAFFSPDAMREVVIYSENMLTFKIRESAGIDKKSGIAKNGRLSVPLLSLDKRKISPSEVIMLFLHAEKNRNWDNYLKYIEIERYINAYPDFVRVYKDTNEEKRWEIIEEFIEFLKQERTDYIIDFKILNELVIEDNVAYVDALVRRFGPKFPFIFNYRYTLESFRDLWVITDVEATVTKE